MPTVDLVGQVFGKLTVIQRAASRKGKTYWLCQCDCDQASIIEVVMSSLTSGNTRSCGCLRREAALQRLAELNKRPEIREARRKQLTEINNRPEFREARRKRLTEIRNRPEFREAMRKQFTEMRKRPGFLEKQLKMLAESRNRPDLFTQFLILKSTFGENP